MQIGYNSEGTIKSGITSPVFIMFQNYHATDMERSAHFINLCARSLLVRKHSYVLYMKLRLYGIVGNLQKDLHWRKDNNDTSYSNF